MHKENTSPQDQQQQMQQLRELVLGEHNDQITRTVRLHARDIVSDVFSEALHDRQNQDGSVNQVLIPLVEKSVEKSVASRSEQFVSYLYPLVGRLVRKSVSAFLAAFLQKTNELIENSLTYKGLTWRYKAWRAGVNFAEYAASQTYVYRVERILLIHRKTGILLNAVHRDPHENQDDDVISAMLTAINDFVADSFHPMESQEQQLEVVQTDDLTLLVRRGPQALLVAAVKGMPPPDMANYLERTLESIHSVYARELSQFEGDSLAFEQTDTTLRECLLSEMRQEVAQKRKRPWLALGLCSVILGLVVAYLWHLYWQTGVIANLKQIDNEPGIIVQQTGTPGWRDFSIALLRDPSAINVNDWLAQQGLQTVDVAVAERAYYSLEPALLERRITAILDQFPSVSLRWESQSPVFSGQLPALDKQRLQTRVAGIAGLQLTSASFDEVAVPVLQNKSADDPEMLQALLDLNIARIEKVELYFEPGQSELDAEQLEKLTLVAQAMQAVIDVSAKLSHQLGLIIMGAADPVGGKAYNLTLSEQRARFVRDTLVSRGLAAELLNPIGLGVVESQVGGSGVRKVFFNVVLFDTR